MSKLIEIPSSDSFDRAVARAQAGRLAMLAALSVAPAGSVLIEEVPRDVFKHNVGDCNGGCGCGSGGSCGGSVCTGGVGSNGGVILLPNGNIVDASDPTNILAGLPGMQQMPNADNKMVPGWQGLYAAAFGQAYQRTRCKPYESAIKDCSMMVTVASTPVTIATTATANVDIQPANGWLDGFYFDLSIRTAAGAALAPESVSMTYPTIVGCATPRCATTGVYSGRVFQAKAECCCGQPFRSIIPRTSEATPLRSAVTNHTGADAVVQTFARGFCHATQICI